MKLFFAHLMTLDDNDYVLTFASPIIDFLIDWTIYDQRIVGLGHLVTEATDQFYRQV